MGDALIAALPHTAEALQKAAQATPGINLSQVKLLPPVARFSKVMAAPTNYHDHIAEMASRPGNAIEAHRGIQAAGIFLKANSSIIGASEAIPLLSGRS
ncbi:hypothetical protein PY365_04165 [Roseiarcaceae bacterium H3SJ34-1]|uniref:hypothetical protein n=1 Tax=Terripilifer ovatus TaxID=3032367 RepID=UPI003AB98555|nr:hypothetical protein [Roseiarcaceae bacterium H3SJ34-1]